MNAVFEYVESHAGLLSTISSVCMLIVTAIYAVITWWQVRYSKQAVIESAKHNKVDKQPFIVPMISQYQVQHLILLLTLEFSCNIILH